MNLKWKFLKKKICYSHKKFPIFEIFFIFQGLIHEKKIHKV